MWKAAFPEYAVKQAFHEQNLERGDEHIVGAMQSDLLSRCITSIVKPALLVCIHHKRKFVNENDIQVGKALNIFPVKNPPEKSGSLVDSREFVNIVDDHMKLCIEHITKNLNGQDLVASEYKISQETMSKLQMEVEACIRGFVDKLGSHVNGGTVSFRNFETVMGQILGDSSYVTFDQGYVSYC